MIQQWAEVEWDSENGKWVTVEVTRRPLKAPGGFGDNAWDSYRTAVRYAHACGLEVPTPHTCDAKCTHGPVEPVGPLDD